MSSSARPSARIILNGLTPQIQIKSTSIPCDITDRTTAVVLDDDQAVEMANGINAAAGGKRFIVTRTNAPDFKRIEDHNFKRVRHGDRNTIELETQKILDRHPELVAELNDRITTVNTEKDLVGNRNLLQRYAEVQDLLVRHAGFTVGKTEEYKDEDIHGKIARFRSKDITPVSLLDERNNLVGIIRALDMGKEFAYLSDETIRQDTLPLRKFSGATKEEQENNRRHFLFAYLLNQAIKALPAHKQQFLIIAADKLEAVYEAMGFKKFPSATHTVQMNLGAPTEELKAAQSTLLQRVKTDVVEPFEAQERVKAARNKRWTLGVWAAAATAVAGAIAISTLTTKPRR